MTHIMKDKVRDIIDDFAKEIREHSTKSQKPTKTIIDFRNDVAANHERDIVSVPIKLLRFRKDNGRITSDVLQYEQEHGSLVEHSSEAQDILRKFLKDKDPLKTEELKKSILSDKQREPAIITCDGFLINGNRRKMVLDELGKENAEFSFMRVVILPGKGEEGGPPTLLDIERIENKYQLMSDGKAEYYGFDRALSMRRKIQHGMSLEMQLRDDAFYKVMNEKEFKKAVQKVYDDYLGPLECIEEYLSHLNKEHQYSIISTGLGDPEGRWQAFIDYYKSVDQTLKDGKWRTKIGISEKEIGKLKDAAFKIIRKREFPGTKAHLLMRNFCNLVENKDAKKELLQLNDVDLKMPHSECLDENGKELPPREIEKRWAKKYEEPLTWHVRKAQNLFEHREEKEKPLDLLSQALKKLNHPNMDAEAVSIFEIKEAMKLLSDIQAKAKDLMSEFYHLEKDNKDKLREKFSR